MSDIANSFEFQNLVDAVMDYCEDIVAVTDLDLKFLDCNKVFLDIFDITDKKDAIGRRYSDIVSPSTTAVVESYFKKTIEENKTQVCTYSARIKGVPHILREAFYPITINGKSYGVLTIARDVTNEEKLKTQLLETNNQLNTLLKHSPLLVYMKDKDKNFITGSKDAIDFVKQGYDPFSNNLQIDMDKAQSTTIEEDDFVLNTGESLIKDKSALDVDGVNHWYRVVKAPIIDNNNKTKGLVTIARNIDEEKKSEMQKDIFIATLAHDLKNPLLAQISSMELMYKGTFGELNDTQKEMLEITIESAKYMREILYSLMATYKYENGVIKLDKKSFDVENLISSCIREASSMASERGIKIVFSSHLNADEKLLFADEKQLRRVIANLFNNGIMYAFTNSEFKVELYKREDKMVFLFENESPEIEEDIKNRIFEKYVTGASKYNKVGSGLGMYLSQKVVEAHDGKIYLDAKGTHNAFILELPIIPENNNEKCIEW